MAWRLAKSLETLRSQVNTAHPDRSKASDGTIGDADHAATASDHNPNAQGVVCAFDLTHDPAHGVDGQKIVDAQRKNPHPNLAYMVWRGQIYSRIRGFNPVPNSGHYSHVHFSVGVGTDGKKKQPYDSTIGWDIGSGSGPSPIPEGRIVATYQTKVNVTFGSDGRGQFSFATPCGAGARLKSAVVSAPFTGWDYGAGDVRLVGAGYTGKPDGGVSGYLAGGKPGAKVDMDCLITY